MTQRIELFLKRWLKEFFLEVCLKEFNFFLIRLKELIFFSNIDSKFRSFFFCGHDSKNWTILWTWLKDFSKKKCDSKNRTFFSMTLDLTFFLKKKKKRLKILIFSKIWLTELQLFFFFEIMTQRIEFFEYDSKNWTFFFSKTTHRIEPFFFFEYDSQNWTLFLWMWPKNWTLISWIRRKELNRLIFAYDSKNWNNFWMTQRMELLYMTQRMELFLNMTYRIDFFEKKKTMPQRNELFFDITQRIEPLKKKLWFKELIFLVSL